MNYDDPIATLFPGAAGRTVAELTRRHIRGEHVVDTAAAATGASVVPDQLTKVVTRLALLGLVEFPVHERITLVRDHVAWFALGRLLDLRGLVDVLVRDVVTYDGVERVLIAGPVPAGTARAFHEGTSVAVVAPDFDLPDHAPEEIAGAVSRGTGNACTVTVVRDPDEARRVLPADGLRPVPAP